MNGAKAHAAARCVTIDSHTIYRLIRLNRLSASEEVDESQAREMLFDVEQAYTAWFKGLS